MPIGAITCVYVICAIRMKFYTFDVIYLLPLPFSNNSLRFVLVYIYIYITSTEKLIQSANRSVRTADSDADLDSDDDQNTQAVAFPKWLADLTKMNDWPGDYPPFISGSVDLNGIPSEPIYTKDQPCRGKCAFDCNGCLGPSDVIVCSTMIQTFDDGPFTSTSRLLQYFFRQRQRVSFFLIGKNVRDLPNIFRRQRRLGHFIGSHTWSHPYLPSLTNEEIAAQLIWTTWVMNATAGYIPTYFRPPYGGMDDRVRAIAGRVGLRPVVWNLDTNDWRMVEEDRTAEQVLSDVQYWEDHNFTGIILEHDRADSTVDVAINIQRIIGRKSQVVATC
ncbi:uncharacterized protein V1516DRAFT_694754 [Lipomyces oligophaga]|uniref:uncharacterized protein n=1 Tax=Lipomyces oligophaga TaxID=45792 RepID=UPI0034CDA915